MSMYSALIKVRKQFVWPPHMILGVGAWNIKAQCDSQSCVEFYNCCIIGNMLRETCIVL